MRGGKWMIGMAALIWTFAPVGGLKSEGGVRGLAERFVQRLEAESGEAPVVRWNAESGTPELLEGRLSKPSRHSPEWISYEFLERAKAAYGLKRVNESMKVASVERSGSGAVTVAMERRLYGKPVCGDGLRIELDESGVVRRVEGTMHADLERKRLHRPMIPAVSGKEAAEEAARYVRGDASAAATARVRDCYLPEREGVPLVYIVSFGAGEGNAAGRTVIVHALTGRVIDG
ncbi:hypothetical protein [Paenibacillus sp. GYB003]|uniref:hypothetical protein n=1 Tax=Paenibacillus sp. GYB003 TaxID=2994392 RepID=UPI002F961685